MIARQALQHVGIDESPDQQISGGIGFKFHQRPHAVLVPRRAVGLRQRTQEREEMNAYMSREGQAARFSLEDVVGADLQRAVGDKAKPQS